MVIFGINLPLKETSGVHSTEKLEYRPRCTTTNLSACNDTIIVLKITLLHSVSVITNFVIPKRDKQTKKHHTISSTADARPTIPTILGMVIEEVRTIFAPSNFFDPISSFATRSYLKFKGKCPHRGKMLITWLFVTRKWPYWKLKSYLQTRLKSENFVKIVQTSDPWLVNLWPKFEILTVLGLYSQISAPINVIFGTVRSSVPNFTFIWATCRPCGRKNLFLD